MFEMQTYEALLEDVLSNAPAGIDTRQGSIFYDAISGICLKIAKMYTDLDQVFQYVFVSTAVGEYLDLRASEYGLTRNKAVQAKYILVYEGTQPAVGARFFHNDTGFYFTVAYSEDDDTVYLVAEAAGTAYNIIHKGDLAVPVNTIEGLTSATFGDVYVEGTDTESDESLRGRVMEKLAGPAENGNRHHYKIWCEEHDNVGMARITALWNGPNTVKAVLITPNGLPCDDDTVAEVQKYIDPADAGGTVEIGGKVYVVGDGLGNGVANLGAHFTATAADAIAINVAFNVELADGRSVDDVQEETADALTAHFRRMVLDNDDAANVVVRLSEVGAIISGLPSVLDYTDLTINGGTDNIYPGVDGVPVVGEVTANDG